MSSTKGRASATPLPTVNLSCLNGSCEACELARSVDWAKTPIGPVDGWSQALRSTASLVLHNHSGMLLWWGPEFVQIYNDAYRPVLGDKHPRAMGQRFRDCWSEVFHILGPMAERPFRGGPASTSDDIAVPINRKVEREEAHFRLAYSPVPDETVQPTGIGGVLATVTEITEQSYAERQIRTLRELAARNADSGRAAEEACRVAATTLAENAWDVPFALFYLLDEHGGGARMVASAGFDEQSLARIAPLAVDFSADADSAAWPIMRVAKERRVEIIVPAAAWREALPRSPWSEQPSTIIALPLAAPDQAHAYGVLICGVSPHRVLDAGYRTFFELVAAQIVTSLRNSYALEEERRRVAALAEIDRAKTAFFSNVSHEFRTPLTLLLGPVQEASANPAAPPQVREQLDLAHRNALRLLKLVNSLLDFSRIEAGRMEACYEPSDLGALTRDLASTFRSMMERAGLNLIVESDDLVEPVFVDREMWEKVVLNLLSNAFKFTLQGEVSVRLRRGATDCVLEVSDTGVGIPESELPRLFERFHRIAGSEGRTQEGSGIGLALVQELVKLHGGKITVASVHGQGTVFRVSIPLGSAHLPPDRIREPRAPAAAALGSRAFVQEALRWIPPVAGETSSQLRTLLDESALANRRFANVAGARILLADDNADMRAYLRDLLAPFYEVELVSDGVQALAAARRQRPDLIVSDIMMPRLDGLGLLKAVRGSDALRDVPVILLSARAGEEARIEGLDASADDYLVKPFSASELVARIGARLELARIRRESEQLLREREEQLRLATEAAEVGLWDVDLVSGTLFWPPRVKAMFGISPDVPVSMADFYAGLHPDDNDAITGAYRAAADPVRRTIYDVEYRTVGKEDGVTRWVAAKGRGIFDGSGKCVRVIGTAIDITSRKRAEEQLSSEIRVQEVLGKLSHDLVAAQLDTGRVIQIATRAGRELSGAAFGAFFYNVKDDKGEWTRRYTLPGASRTVFSRFPQARIAALFAPRLAAEGVARSADITVDPRYGNNEPHRPLPDGHFPVRSYLAVPAKTMSGEVLGGLFFGHPDPGVFNERAERLVLAVAAQAAVALENARLHEASQREIEQRTRMEAALSEADRRKDEFLAMLAHELRNPLAPISNATELLARMLGENDRARDVVGMVKRQATHLTRLVDDLLDVSRVTLGRIELSRHPIDVASVIAQAVETVEPQLRIKQHHLSIVNSSYQSLFVDGDFARLVQCISNLLTNAAKYTEAGGEIWVRTRAENASAVIEVEDTGAGISPELLPKVFDLFVQSDRTVDRSQGGLGIGLSVVKRLVEMHGGEVTAASPGAGQGSTFAIRLPRIAKPEAPSVDVARFKAPPRRVLVVDDNRDAADSLALLLDIEGHESRTAYSGKEALSVIDSFKPDVAILDLGLPEMDGYELAERLRSLSTSNGIRLVALTGYGQAEDRERTKAAGFDDHLVKPVDLLALEHSLARM